MTPETMEILLYLRVNRKHWDVNVVQNVVNNVVNIDNTEDEDIDNDNLSLSSSSSSSIFS